MKIDELLDFANRAKEEGATEVTVNCLENIIFTNGRDEIAWIDDTENIAQYCKDRQ